jgi:hypothetical protein
MATHSLQSPNASGLPRWVIVGFISGFLSVLIFHQGVFAVLHSANVIPRAAYSMNPTAPMGVPQLWSLAFWGGIWGAVLAASFARLSGARLIVASLIFGAILPSLVYWFVVLPIKGQPVGNGFALKGILLALILNGAWGLGTGIGLALFGRAPAKTSAAS